MFYIIRILLNCVSLSFFSKFNYYPEYLTNKLLINVKNSNAFIIKLSQWICTRYDSLEDTSLSKFYELFDNNSYHSFDYSKSVIEEAFPKFLNEIQIHERIASGSIAQVYRGTFQGKDVAIKILHQNVLKDIYVTKRIIQAILKIVNKLNICENISKHIDFEDFWKKFWKQTDLCEEAKNIQKFNEYFKDSRQVITIPEVYLYSNKCIIMSYHAGDFIHEIESSYNRYKSIMCLVVFFTCCSKKFGVLHGDLHKGNWKVVIDESGNFERIIVYDFGICHCVDVVNFEKFLNYYDNAQWDKVIDICINMWSTNEIEENTRSLIIDSFVKHMNLQILPMKSNLILSYIIKTMKIYNLSIKPDILNALISFTNIEKFVHDNTDMRYEMRDDDFHGKCISSNLKSHMSFCKTYNCFPEYLEHCKVQYSTIGKVDLFGKYKDYAADLDKFYSS